MYLIKNNKISFLIKKALANKSKIAFTEKERKKEEKGNKR